MSAKKPKVAIEEAPGLSRHDVLVRGGLLATGAAVLSSSFTAGIANAGSGLKFAFITHGAVGGSFWYVAERGAKDAGKVLGVTVLDQGANNDPVLQAQYISTAVSQKVDGIATSLPAPQALSDPIKRAVAAGIPVITLNSGVDQYKAVGALTHVGQTETIAGAGAGTRLNALGLKKLLVVIHEQGNIGLEDRFSGAKSTFKGQVERLQIAGLGDLVKSQSQIQSKLAADKSIDSVLTLNPTVGISALNAIQAGGSKVTLATFDLSPDVITAIQKGQIVFAIDQQQYLQGYLPITFLYLYKTNLNTVGGGLPVLTGPSFVDKSNAATVAALTAKGTR
jgi:simple sugar transport system substrate-binding protein